MNKIFALGIPTVNRADLLNAALEKYVEDFPNTWILVFDNGRQEIFTHPLIQVLRPDPPERGNIGVAASWNKLCNKMFYEMGLMYGYILNDDIYSGRTSRDILLLLDRLYDQDLIASPAGWSNFLLPRETYGIVGGFDEKFFPAYYEDNDFHYRMKLKGMKYTISETLLPDVLRVSASIQKDPSLHGGVEACLARYIAKWGGSPGEETFRQPFDGLYLTLNHGL